MTGRTDLDTFCVFADMYTTAAASLFEMENAAMKLPSPSRPHHRPPFPSLLDGT